MSDKTELKDKDLKKVSGGTQNTFEPGGSNCPKGLTSMKNCICKTCIYKSSVDGGGYCCSKGVAGLIYG